MLQSLLVPLDGSEFSERTLPLAHGLAKATGASLHLAHVHVSHTPDHFLSNTQFHFEGLDLAEYETRHREEEKAYLGAMEDRLGRHPRGFGAAGGAGWPTRSPNTPPASARTWCS